MDHRQEALNRSTNYKRRTNDFGTGTYGIFVDWFAFDKDASSSHDVYNEGTGRRYKPSRRVYLLQLVVGDPDDEMTPEGRRQQQILRASVTVNQLLAAGVPDPSDIDARLSDVIRYEGDYYNMLTYTPRGHIGEGPSEETVPFTAVRTRDFDAPLDAFPTDVDEVPWG